MLTHPIPPCYDENSVVLILGSFPSVKSREQGFFYGHPQNRFWRVLAALFDAEVPESVDDRKNFLHLHGIALWDVIASCEILGSSDVSIRNAAANDISFVLDNCNINRIFVNGRTADRLYRRYIEPAIGRAAEYLPSTSPANAAYGFERLCAEWQAVREAVKANSAGSHDQV